MDIFQWMINEVYKQLIIHCVNKATSETLENLT